MTEIEKAQTVISKIDSAIAMLGGTSAHARKCLELAREQLMTEVHRMRKMGYPETNH